MNDFLAVNMMNLDATHFENHKNKHGQLNDGPTCTVGTYNIFHSSFRLF